MDTTILNLAAAVASAVAAVASVVVVARIGQRAEALTIAQQRHAEFSAVAEWRRDLREWADEAIDVLSEAAYDNDPGESPSDTRSSERYCSRLSALIDQGRFFLPNVRLDEHGIHKPTAYRGYRHSALDPLVAAERVLSANRLGRFATRTKALLEMKREFVSAIQRILDPARNNEAIATMIRTGNAARSDDPTLGGLVSGEGAIPLGAEALISNQWSRARVEN